MDAASFASAIGGWHDYYIMIGTASATLVGLLFVGLSVNLELVRRPESADMRTLAALSFNSFIYPLLFAIVFLIPNISPEGLGFPLIGIGFAGLVSTLLQYVRERRRHRGLGRGTLRFLPPIVCYIGVIPIGLSVLALQTAWLYWLVPITIVLLATASRHAWDLLFGARIS